MAEQKPIPVRLPCPDCGELHVDEGSWAEKPHHTHACQLCGNVWRPAVVATVGVRFLPGFKNDEAHPPLRQSSLQPENGWKGCHAARDGECIWEGCPQIRDGEPQRTGRHCPLDVGEEE